MCSMRCLVCRIYVFPINYLQHTAVASMCLIHFYPPFVQEKAYMWRFRQENLGFWKLYFSAQQNLFTILKTLSCWHSSPLSVCYCLLSVDEKESRSLCGICDEVKKITLIYFVEEKLNKRDSIVDEDRDRNFY
jgi:hypothetical protein